MSIIGENSLTAVSIPHFYALNASLAGLEGEDNELSVLLKTLNKCENHGDWVCRKILDTNNRYSYGGLQFQLQSFLNYGKKYSILPQLMTIEEAREYVCEQGLQTAIALKMIKNGEGKRNWLNCWIKYNLDQYL